MFMRAGSGGGGGAAADLHVAAASLLKTAGVRLYANLSSQFGWSDASGDLKLPAVMGVGVLHQARQRQHMATKHCESLTDAQNIS